jgi:uncharacterized protein YqfB (UPF0267 family)
MGKLFFQDDNGTQHQINLQNVQTKYFSPGDVIVAYYEVGETPLDQSNMALEQLQTLLKSVFPPEIKVVTIATRHGSKDVDIKSFKHKGNVEVPNNGQG